MRQLFPRLIAAVLILLSAATPAFAVEFDAGLKTGYSAATLSGDIIDLPGDFTYRSGFTGGLFFDFAVTERLSIQLEATYVQRGAWIRDIAIVIPTQEGPLPAEQDYEFRLWYFDFPILLKYTLRNENRLSPFILAGASYAKSQRTIIQVTTEFGPYSWGARDDISTLMRSWDVNAIFGGGLGISLWSIEILLEGRYYLGLMNLDNTDSGESLKNRAIGAYLGIAIPFSE